MTEAKNVELDEKVIEEATAQAAPEEQIVTLQLSVEEVNLTLSALQELPFRVSSNIINKIVAQGQAQVGQ